MDLKEMLKTHEGLDLKTYRDKAGKLTIGYGRNLDDVGISMSEAETLLDNDIATARHGAEKTFGWFGILDPVRQDVIVMLTFNMGIAKLLNFNEMIKAIQCGNFHKAGEEMLSSLWARQVGNRAFVLSRMMKTGMYPKGLTFV